MFCNYFMILCGGSATGDIISLLLVVRWIFGGDLSIGSCVLVTESAIVSQNILTNFFRVAAG